MFQRAIVYCNNLMQFQSQEHEEMSMLAVQLATKFLFQVGFHTKKTLRGPASDW